MTKYVRVVVLFLVVALLTTACNVTETTDEETTVDWCAVIRNDLLSGKTTLEKVVAEKVDIQAVFSDDILEITVSSPEICDELLLWMNTVDDIDFSVEALETEILRLLDTSPSVTVTFYLTFRQENEEIIIDYTQEFFDALSCGLSRFNREITQYLTNEMVD